MHPQKLIIIIKTLSHLSEIGFANFMFSIPHIYQNPYISNLKLVTLHTIKLQNNFKKKDKINPYMDPTKTKKRKINSPNQLLI